MSWKKVALVGVTILVVPGSSLILLGYGLKAYLDWRKRIG